MKKRRCLEKVISLTADLADECDRMYMRIESQIENFRCVEQGAIAVHARERLGYLNAQFAGMSRYAQRLLDELKEEA